MNHILKSIESLQEKRLPLIAERHALRTMSRAEVLEQFEAQVKAATTHGVRRLVEAMQCSAEGQAAMPLAVRGAAAVSAAPGAASFTIDLTPLLAPLVGEQLLTLARRAAEALPVGLPKAQREARIAEINVELDVIERDEEALIVRAQQQGMDVERREDARPEIVLAIVKGKGAAR